MDMSLTQKLQMYIDAETGDSMLYRELANIAPDEDDSNLLLEFADDEQRHADEFKRVYRILTGKTYNAEIPQPDISGHYYDILRDRVLDESNDFRKYGEDYLMTNRNDVLKRAYYTAGMDENVHALRLLYMLSKERYNMTR